MSVDLKHAEVSRFPIYTFNVPSGGTLQINHHESAEWIDGMITRIAELETENKHLRVILDHLTETLAKLHGDGE